MKKRIFQRRGGNPLQYNVSPERYKEILEIQGWRCGNKGCNKILNLTDPTASRGDRQNIDHCKRTQAVRGLLCGNCNKALGMVDDKINALNGLIEYLQAGNDYRDLNITPRPKSQEIEPYEVFPHRVYGATYQEIADAYGFSVTKIYKICKRAEDFMLSDDIRNRYSESWKIRIMEWVEQEVWDIATVYAVPGCTEEDYPTVEAISNRLKTHPEVIVSTLRKLGREYGNGQINNIVEFYRAKDYVYPDEENGYEPYWKYERRQIIADWLNPPPPKVPKVKKPKRLKPNVDPAA